MMYPCARPRDQRLVTVRLARFKPSRRTNTLGKQRLSQIAGSSLGQYWTAMTGQDDQRQMPVPRGINQTGAPRWEEVDKASSPVGLNEAVTALYGISRQDQVQVRDTLRYLDPEDGLGPAGPLHLEAFARRICLQFNEILRHGSRQFAASALTFPPGEDLRACRFDLVETPGEDHRRDQGPIQVRRENSTREQFLGETIPEARETIINLTPERGTLRIYDQTTVWLVAANRERLWCEAQALDVGDRIAQEVFENGTMDQKPRPEAQTR